MFSLIFCSIHLYGQSDSEDVIYLKNGRIYAGSIIERIPDISYKIQLSNGQYKRVFVEDVRQITTEPKGKVKTFIPRLTPPLVNIETAISYIMSFNGFSPGIKGSYISYGGGISFLPEIHKRHRSFSFLTGVAVQILSASKYSYYDALVSSGNGYIEKGYSTRFRVPMWFRWTFGQKSTTGFFQFGWAIGVDYYQGKGTLEINGGHCQGCYQKHEGWQKFTTTSFSLSTIGAGIRRNITPQLQIISYVEGSPLTLRLYGSDTYQPYVQFHCGLNFAPKKLK